MAKAQSKVKWTTYCDHLKECMMKIYENDQNYDVTLVCCDGRTINVHQIVLTMSSNFFVDILKDFPAHLPPVISIPDMKYEILEQVVNFMYNGEIQLSSNQLSDFLESFSLFQLKGLEYNNGRFSGVTLRVDNPSVEFEMIEEDEELIEEAPPTHIVYQEEAATNIKDQQDSVVTQAVEMIEENEMYDSEVVSEINTAYGSNVFVSQTKTKRGKSVEYGDKLESAVNAVLAGKSFRSVSQEFDIPKTVLWRRVSKLSVYQKTKPELPDIRKMAMEEMKNGQTLLSIRDKYNIPLSTLHRDKMRLYNQGNLPENVALKNRDKNFKQRVLEAAENCLKGTMTQSDAARAFNLPKTTIWRRLKQLKEKGENLDNVLDFTENPVEGIDDHQKTTLDNVKNENLKSQ